MPRSTAEWDESARQYDRFENKWHYYGRVAQGLARRMKIAGASKVLELASGTGASTVVLASRCRTGSVTCVERSAGMMALARKNLDAAGLDNATFLLGDVGDLARLVRGLPPFDCAFCNSAFWHFPEPLEVMKAVRGSLKAGGTFGFNIPAYMLGGTRLDEYRRIAREVLVKHGIELGERRPRVKRDYAELLEKAGFKEIEEGQYSLTMAAKEGEEWRAIPVFSRPWSWNRDIPPGVLAEIRRRAIKADLTTRPRARTGRNLWNYFLARC